MFKVNNKNTSVSSVSVVDFEQVNVGWQATITMKLSLEYEKILNCITRLNFILDGEG